MAGAPGACAAVGRDGYQSKLAVCAELRLRWLLDDSFDHTADLAGRADTALVLIEMPWNRSALIDARGVRVVRDWASYVELVEGMDPGREAHPTSA